MFLQDTFIYCSSACQYIALALSSSDNSYAFFLIFTNTHQIIILSQSLACWMVLSLALLGNSVRCRLYSLRWEWQWRDCSSSKHEYNFSNSLATAYTHIGRIQTQTTGVVQRVSFVKSNLKINHFNVESCKLLSRFLYLYHPQRRILPKLYRLVVGNFERLQENHMVRVSAVTGYWWSGMWERIRARKILKGVALKQWRR